MNFAVSPKATKWIVAVCLVLAGAYAAARLAMEWRDPSHPEHPMDDAYMFYRYAMNLRHGLGVSWNPDGVPTYGETSPLWGLAVLLLSYLPLSATHVLMLGSCLCAAAGVAAISWAVARNAKSGFMRSTWRVLPMVALPLLFTHTYLPHALTGMETMLAAGLAGVFTGAAIGWTNGVCRPETVAGIGLLLFLTRPESALAVVVFAALAGLTGMASRGEVARLLCVFLAGILLDLLVCKIYFHTALPLSFYMKGRHAYEGYHLSWRPLTHALEMLGDCSVFLVVLALFIRGPERRLAAICLTPALCTFCYLVTVTQIMGGWGRYYAPYFAFFIVPSLLVLDSRIASPERQPGETGPRERALYLGGAAAAAACVVLLLGFHRVNAALSETERAIEARPFVYDGVACEIKGKDELPVVDRNVRDVAEFFVASLPAGVSIAASEVGYIGVANPAATVIDLEGLNDTPIALHGFNVEELLARRPDVIWMPHPDYTYQRGILMSSPLLLQQYDLFAGAGGYGIAVRKDSPMRAAIMRQMEIFWRRFYAQYPMDDYVARSVRWSGHKYRAVGY